MELNYVSFILVTVTHLGSGRLRGAEPLGINVAKPSPAQRKQQSLLPLFGAGETKGLFLLENHQDLGRGGEPGRAGWSGGLPRQAQGGKLASARLQGTEAILEPDPRGEQPFWFIWGSHWDGGCHIPGTLVLTFQ